jgi:short-subunit dehydrogenase
MQVNGKVIVVTGGGDGIGRQIVTLLLQKGARVAAVDIRQDALDETRAAVGGHAERLSTHVADITDRERVFALPAEVEAAHGPVDAIVNNAGVIQPFVRVHELEMETIDRVLAVNLVGPVNVTKAFLPGLMARPEAHILNVSSMGGFLPVPGQAIYGTAKAGVKLFTEALHSELAGTNVGVTVVFPGGVGTRISENSGVEVPGNLSEAEAEKMAARATSPEEAARIIVGGIEEGAQRVLVGSDAKLMDRLSRLNPKFAAGFITKQMKDLLG